MKNRPIELIKEGSRIVARVPLGRSGEHKAEIYKEDYDFLVKLGLSGNWNALRASLGLFYVVASAYKVASNKTLVARILLDADAGQSVQYVDKNPLNLRRENLRLVPHGNALSRARNFIRPKSILEFA